MADLEQQPDSFNLSTDAFYSNLCHHTLTAAHVDKKR